MHRQKRSNHVQSKKNKGKRAVVTDKIIDSDCGIIFSAPSGMVGVKGIIRYYENTAYDTPYPTGYERTYYWIEIDPDTLNYDLLISTYGENWHWYTKCIPVDAACIKILD